MNLLRNTLLSAVLFLAVSVEAQQAVPIAPPTPGAGTSRPAGQGAFQKKKARPMPKAEWLEPNRDAPNGTQYKTFASKVLGRGVSYLIYLPPDYERQPAKRYPVIYWLHGMGTNQLAGAAMFVPQVETAIREGVLPPVIVVLVNGMVRSFYCDSSDGQCPTESVIIKDLIPHIDQTYRTVASREGRVIEGYSMGGYGAAHLGFKYPDLFGTVVINAGALLEPNLSNVPKDGPMYAVFGEDKARRVAEHPLQLARQNADKLRGRTHIRIGCGSLDNLLPGNQELHDLLSRLGIEHQYEIVPGVAHMTGAYYRKVGTGVFEFHRRSLAASSKPVMPQPGDGQANNPANDSPLARLSFQPSMQAGSRDPNGNLILGTEVMHLVPHRGRLYAGTALWMEEDPATPKACQVLALDSAQGQWRVEHQFSTNNLRWGCLKEITFSAPKTSLLLASPDVRSGPVKVYRRSDDTGEWTASVVGTVANYTQTRSLGLHRDSVTGAERLFAGVDKLGVRSGVYDPAAPGRIRWNNSAEFQTPAGERVMAFCNCNGKFYCATSRHIYQRADGPAPSWKEIYFCPQETSPSGIRGLSAVPNPLGAGEVLLFAALSKVRRLDPADGFKETIELDTPQFLTRQLGLKVTYVLGAYNEFLPCTTPSGENVWLFGFECCHPEVVVKANPRLQGRMQIKEKPRRAYFAGEARYCVRHANGTNIRYDLAEILDPRLPSLVSVRAIAVSPFPEDRERAFYFGGYDCNSVPSHNTAWIYRAEVRPP